MATQSYLQGFNQHEMSGFLDIRIGYLDIDILSWSS